MNITKGACFVLVEHSRIGDGCKQMNVSSDEGRKNQTGKGSGITDGCCFRQGGLRGPLSGMERPKKC